MQQVKRWILSTPVGISSAASAYRWPTTACWHSTQLHMDGRTIVRLISADDSNQPQPTGLSESQRRRID